ncbi:Velvet complex subunit 2 [Colletotrichum gloeosporioides]|uniref:Velvet complex subunit 2 n=1 Tax=Colletotrichum gloeosporioides TaxID=474922 RepID=A0A8H4CJ34_COLGL|nr:Velvet complex subunit 2 [Colletotrichum gloeosporioides]KAF3804910.1 Velvet complex subunit 2 [Colletotrichum gloeosporioides]
MNYDQQHPASGGYHHQQHMPPNPYAQQQLPPPHQQHHPQHPQQHPHHAHPSSQIPQLPPMSFPPPAPVPSNMPPNGVPPQHPPAVSSGPAASTSASQGQPPSFSRTDDLGRQYEFVKRPSKSREVLCLQSPGSWLSSNPSERACADSVTRVKVFNPETGREFSVNEVEHGHFIINVDLWDEKAQHEVNLVRHSSTTASISTTTPTPFHTLRQDPPGMPPYADLIPGYAAGPAYGQQQQPPPIPGYQGYQPPPTAYTSTNASFAPPTQYFPNHAASTVPSQADMTYGHRQSMSMATNQPQGMFTRNLIGSLASSAFRLSDTEDNVGIWFVMQDLSVRTEGLFRLRFSFVSVAKRAGQPSAAGSLVNMGKSNVLAQCWSDVFQVYSAKKFPGVCESTPLSKCFAHQGIKIPIRKDGPSDGKKNNEEDEEF